MANQLLILLGVSAVLFAASVSAGATQACGTLPYIDSFQGFIDSMKDNKKIHKAFEDWKDSMPVANDGELGHCNEQFKDATNVCCQKNVRGIFNHALGHLMHGKRFKPEKSGCMKGAQMTSAMMKSCKLTPPSELDGEHIKMQMRDSEKDTRKAIAQSIIESIRLLRGNLCLLCVDPNDAVTLAKFWDGENILINQEGWDQFMTAKEAAITKLDDLNKDCQAAIDKGTAAINNDAQCKKKAEQMLKRMQDNKDKGQQPKDDIQANQRAFDMGNPEGPMADPEHEPDTRILDYTVGDMKIVSTGGLQTYVVDSTFDDGEIKAESTITTLNSTAQNNASNNAAFISIAVVFSALFALFL